MWLHFSSKSPAEKEVSNFSRLCLTPLGLKASGLASLTANTSHGKPPMIGPVAERHGGDKRAQPFAVIRFLFGRALIVGGLAMLSPTGLRPNGFPDGTVAAAEPSSLTEELRHYLRTETIWPC